MAHRVRGSPIAGKRISLAPAATEIFRAANAAGARLPHPCRAAKCVEGWRLLPNLRKRMLAYGPKFQIGNGLRRMTRQHQAVGRHIERPAPPTTDTRF